MNDAGGMQGGSGHHVVAKHESRFGKRIQPSQLADGDEEGGGGRAGKRRLETER